MTTYDAIVVGAGPAGSTAARLLAQRGARALLLDRARFPRDKPCAGGVTVQAAKQLDIGISPVVERTISKVRASFRLGRPFLRSSPEPLAYMTQRRRLDALLAERAAEAGAEFRDGVAVRGVETAEGSVTVRTGDETLRARALVGADGANGVAARALGLTHLREPAVALEGNVPAEGSLMDAWERTIALDLGGTPGGYGWLFPRGDHLNVGVGGWRRLGPTLRQRLSALCRHLELDESKLFEVRGYHLPMRAAGGAIVRGPALLAGDAAGLVDPLSGEGIGAAFVSGRLAAESIRRYLAGETADLSDYETAVERELMADIEVSHKLQATFHLIPWACVTVMRHSDLFWRTLCRMVRGETTYSEFQRKLGPLRLALEVTARIGAPKPAREAGASRRN